MRDALGCDDPIVQRRFAYARGTAKDGDFATAAEVLEQTVELAPNWAAAWFALAEAREKMGDDHAAAAAFRAALRFDPNDAQGAGPRLALIEKRESASLPPAYVARLFDDYAARFDAHLTRELVYRGPDLIVAALDRIAPGRRFDQALDLGCGTGLVGAALGGRAKHLVGVDLSAKMVAKAREAGFYEALEVGDVVEFLSAQATQCADLIVAADVLIYLGDLEPLFGGIVRTLAPGGLFAFSVEAIEHGGYRLKSTMRFAHSERYLREAAARAGLAPLVVQAATTRREAGCEVDGLIAVLRVAR
jgi:predicted TPR repeat methyltransferase